MQKEVLVVVGLIVGLIAGMVIGYSIGSVNSTKPQTTPKKGEEILPEEIASNAVAYINQNLLSPGIKSKLIDITSLNQNLYKLDLEIYRGNTSLAKTSVYVTKDGNYLILKLVNMNESLVERVDVSVDDDPWRGKDDAKIVVVEFSDYSCPYCAKFELEILPKLLEEYEGRVKFVFRDFPVHGEVAIKAAEAANCANEQGKYWEYHELLFEKRLEWYQNTSKFEDYAAELGLNVSKFKECLDSDKYREEVLLDREDGVEAGVEGTPTIFINGIKIVGAQPFEVFKEVIDQELAKNS
ncbi:DsbA family protein [Archaeoglobales archaeon]|nr:MAG: DsbA family protein [Archaeoglobales archaeon]